MKNRHSYNHAVDIYNEGKYEQALALALPLVDELEPQGEFLLLIGNCYSLMEQPEKALPYLKGATKLLPVSPFATNSLYSAYMDLRMFEEAFDEMEIYLRVNSSIEYDETIIGFAEAVGYRFEVVDEEGLLDEVRTDICKGSDIIWPELRARIIAALRHAEERKK